MSPGVPYGETSQNRAWIDNEKLEAIFRAGIEKLPRQLKDVVTMARRVGRIDDAGETEPNIEVGQATRLIQLCKLSWS